MWRAFIPMIILFMFHVDGAGVFGIITEKMFWMLQKYFMAVFILGAVGYLLSFTIRTDDNLDF